MCEGFKNVFEWVTKLTNRGSQVQVQIGGEQHFTILKLKCNKNSLKLKCNKKKYFIIIEETYLVTYDSMTKKFPV